VLSLCLWSTQVDKFISNFEFMNQKVYGCQVVITNVSCARQNLDVLLQVCACVRGRCLSG
jgi:hypothetical protein